MSALLKIVDEHFGPQGVDRRPGVDLRLASERTTPREIIRQRVKAELAALAQRKSDLDANRSYLIAIEPASSEARLNLPFVARRAASPETRVDLEAERAFAAFSKQRFIMLFDDRQIEDLDTAVTVTPESKVVFLYLSPLKGG